MPAKSNEPPLPQGFPGLALLPNELLLCSFRPDLDDALRFSSGLVLLSSAHLHVQESADRFHSIRLSPTLELRKKLGEAQRKP